MKFRFAPSILLSLFAIPLLPLSAQEQVAAAPDAAAPMAAAIPAAPLQLQDPAASPAPGGREGASAQVPAPTDSVTPAAAAPVDQATFDPNAPTANSGMGSPGENPPPSDPNSLIPPPAEPEQPSPINAAGNEEKQRQEQKARYYSVKVKADKEESLASLLQKSDKAKSEESKRQALREYYDLLAKRMKKLDPSLSEWIDTMHSAYLRRLAQDRLEPTIPVNLPPAVDGTGQAAPAPAPSASPSPSPKKKKRSSSAR